MRTTRAATMGAVEKIGRNDPCPCGSGRKYKLCCGAVARVVPVAPQAQAVPATAPAPERACGGCTACCEGWAASTVRGHAMYPGQPCHFLHGGRGGTCSIYVDRPAVPCRNFECGWLRAGSPFPDEFRPDRCGVIIVPMRWRGRTAYVLLSAGQEPGPAMLEWMQAHARATGSPLFYEQRGQRIGYGPPEFQHEMLAKLQRGEKLW